MLQYLGHNALDLANERAREARNQAEGWRLLGSDVHVRETPARPSFGRRAAAGVLRRFSSASLPWARRLLRGRDAPLEQRRNVAPPTRWRPR